MRMLQRVGLCQGSEKKMNEWHRCVGNRFEAFARVVVRMKALLNGKQTGRLLLLMVLTTVVTACSHYTNGSGGLPVQQSTLSLDLPLEPAATRTRVASLPVQTTPPPLKTGSEVQQLDMDFRPPNRPPREFGIPARDSGQTTREHGIPARSVGMTAQEITPPHQQATQPVTQRRGSATKPPKSPAKKAGSASSTQARRGTPIEVRPRPTSGSTEELPPK